MVCQGVCPSCNGRRMPQTAAHMVNHVIPPVPMRQRVISVPKRLRWFLGQWPGTVVSVEFLPARPITPGDINTLTE